MLHQTFNGSEATNYNYPYSSYKKTNPSDKGRMSKTGKKDLNLAPPEKLVNEFYSKFLLIYGTLTKRKQKRASIFEYNRDLMMKINEEEENGKTIISKLNEENKSLVVMKTQLSRLSPSKKDGIAIFKSEIKERLDQIKNLNNQIKLSIEELSEETEKCNIIQRDVMYSENEPRAMVLRREKADAYIVHLERGLMNKELEIKDTQMKIKKFIHEVNEIDSSMQGAIEMEEEQQQDMKKNIENYREILKKYNNGAKKKQDDEKFLKKLDEDLQSKTKRLDVILQNNKKYEHKLEYYDNIKDELGELITNNEVLANENEDLRLYVNENVDPNFFKLNEFKNAYRKIINNTNLPSTKHMTFSLSSGASSKNIKTQIKEIAHQPKTFESTEGDSVRFEFTIQHHELEKAFLEYNQLEINKNRLADECDKNDKLVKLNDNQIHSLIGNHKLIDKTINVFIQEYETIISNYNQESVELNLIQAKYNDTFKALPEHIKQALIDIEDEEDPPTISRVPTPSKLSDNDMDGENEAIRFCVSQNDWYKSMPVDVLSQRALSDCA